MTRRLAGAAAVALTLALALSPPPAGAQQPLPGIADKTRGLEKKDGFIPLYWDAQGGKLWM